MTGVPFALAVAVPLYAVAYGYGKVDPRLILAQSALETANWKSRIYLENRNAFGLKVPRIRPTTNVGEQYGHARFDSVAASVQDYFLRQRAFDIPDTSDAAQYVERTAASGYATAPDYRSAWLSRYASGLSVSVVPLVLPLALAAWNFRP